MDAVSMLRRKEKGNSKARYMAFDFFQCLKCPGMQCIVQNKKI